MNSLVQESLLATQHISQAAVIRKKDGVKKARTPGFEIAAEEFQQIERAFEFPSEVRDIGLKLAGVSYRPVRVDDLSIYAKSELKNGVIIARTNTFLIFGLYDGTMYPSVAVEAVEKLADYFRKKGK